MNVPISNEPNNPFHVVEGIGTLLVCTVRYNMYSLLTLLYSDLTYMHVPEQASTCPRTTWFIQLS